MNSITITLPLPDKCLSPNARVHWAKKAKVVKSYREVAQWAAFKKMNPSPVKWQNATYKALFYFPDARRRDADNAIASIKSALDGVADAGLVVNDSGLWPDRPTIAKDKDNPRIMITITKE
jgi:crossover junction endodeoxyribonuclease RusA